jgi:nucleotide-binding universal stress UspA family protein
MEVQVMRDRLLLAIDQFEPGQAAVDFTIGLAGRSGAHVTVCHVREMSKSLRVPPIETLADARLLVDHTVLRMQEAGIATEGHTCSSREDVAKVIVDESSHRKCDAIVLGSLRLRGFHRVGGHGVRERVLKYSPLPVIVTPTALCGGRGAMGLDLVAL